MHFPSPLLLPHFSLPVPCFPSPYRRVTVPSSCSHSGADRVPGARWRLDQVHRRRPRDLQAQSAEAAAGRERAVGPPEGRPLQVPEGAPAPEVPDHQQQPHRRAAQRHLRRPEEHGDPLEGPVEAAHQEVPVEGEAGTLLRWPGTHQ